MRRLDIRTFLLGSAVLTIAGTAAAEDPPTKQACIDAHEQAQFLKRKGKLIAERENLLVCSQDACPEILRVACVGWLDDNLRSLPTIVLEAHDENNRPTEDVRVSIDGQAAKERLDGRAQPIDPGEHVFRFTDGKGATREVKVVISEGQKNKIIVGEFGETPKAGAGIDLAELDRVAAARSRRTVGFVVGGIGAAALATGAIFGFLALQAKEDARCTSPCPELSEPNVRNPRLREAEDAYDRSNTFAWVSNIGLAAGVVGLGIGTYLVLTSNTKSKTTGWLAPSPLPGGGGLSLGGAL